MSFEWRIMNVARPALTAVTPEDLNQTIVGQSVYIRKLECVLFRREMQVADLERLRNEALKERDEARRERDDLARKLASVARACPYCDALLPLGAAMCPKCSQGPEEK